MKQRFAGRVSGEFYEVTRPDGSVALRTPLGEADRKLKAAIERNGWEKIPE